MIGALLVFGYAIALAWILPLGRLSEPGISPRLGLAAWLAAMTSVLATALAAPGQRPDPGPRRGGPHRGRPG
ncbi:MAG: hypothetical protein ACRDP5_20320 [Streptosporangiaceae bacterium]